MTTDRELWKGRINRAYMESRVGTEAAGLAILAGVIDGIATDLSRLMEAQLKAVEKTNKEIREELQIIRRRIW